MPVIVLFVVLSDENPFSLFALRRMFIGGVAVAVWFKLERPQSSS
jgi:hypothetical protein